MKVLSLIDIVVPEGRFRQKFDRKALDELKASIKGIGLLHPPTVENVNGTWTLRAGERRLRILRELHNENVAIRCGDVIHAQGEAPFVDFAELTELQRVEIEVEETLVRADFDWKERIRGLERLHLLRKAQNPGQTITETASEVLGKPAQGDQVQVVSDALILAKHLDDPDVAKAKSARDAIKVVKRKAEAVQSAKLAKLVDTTRTPHTLLKGDTRELLRTLPAGSFDVILTDPPYGIAADNFGSMSGTGHKYEDSYTYWKELMVLFSDESARVAKDKAHLYAFCDTRRFDELSAFLVLANWTVFPHPLIWDKCGVGMLPFPDHGPRRTYEAILFAWRGDKQVCIKGRNDVIRVPAVKDLKHGAQKPVALYQNLLERSARPGDRVLDCFGGSGTILVASNRLKLLATYIEGEDEAFNIATSRIAVSTVDDGALEKDGLEDLAF